MTKPVILTNKISISVSRVEGEVKRLKERELDIMYIQCVDIKLITKNGM